jgi:hypothetical protein
MSAVSAAGSPGLPIIRRMTAEELGGIRAAPPARPERVERLLDAAVRFGESNRIQQETAISGLAHYETHRVVVANIVDNLPKGTSSAERELWRNELNGVDDSIKYYQNQTRVLGTSTATQLQEQRFEFLSKFLGKPIDEIKTMYQERLDQKI